MKQIITLLVLFLFTTIGFSQKTWNGNGDGFSWHDQDNWSGNAIPALTDNVVIPDGFSVTIPTSAAFCSSLMIEGASNLNIGADLTFTGLMTIGTDATVNWSSGWLRGGGSVDNQGIITLTSFNVAIVDGVTINNSDEMNIIGSGNLVLTNGILNNNGTIEMTSSGGISFVSNGLTHLLNNSGIIKKTTSSGEVSIAAEFNNTGTIQVEDGTLTISSSSQEKNWIGGIYNVNFGTTMNWASDLTLLGTIQGGMNGTLNISANINVDPGTIATLNLFGIGTINWLQKSLQGGGTLINKNVINLTTNQIKRIQQNSIFQNEGRLNFTSIGDLFIEDGSLNNTSLGIIDLQTDSGNIGWATGTIHSLNNEGIIMRTSSSGIASISANTVNSGIIEIQSGELEFLGSQGFSNQINGIVKGIGVIDLPLVSNFTNDGTFSPGLSPGTLIVQGDYISSASSILDIELDGLNQGMDYDLMAIQGDAIFNGVVNITLGFEPSLNDEFIVATTTGTISSCNLVNTASASINGNTFNFDVICRNDNEVVLIVNNMTLGVDDYQSLETDILVYPNPTQDHVFFSSEKLKLDTVKIFNISGQLVYEHTLGNSYIDLTELDPGLYLLSIATDKGNMFKKIIKE